jgi:peptide/nickel transport system ATP-binding protein
MTDRELRQARGETFAYVFQDYQSAFTPFIKVGKQMHEMIRAHRKMTRSEEKEKILKGFEDVGLDAERIYGSYPFQMSGGQLQRCAIAQAMLLEPDLLIADEPTTALDSVSTLTVLELIKKIKTDCGCAILFISHDLRTVKSYADQIAIMYKGEIVEYRPRDDIFADPQHEYTKNLFAAIPPLRNVPDRLPIMEMEKQA